MEVQQEQEMQDAQADTAYTQVLEILGSEDFRGNYEKACQILEEQLQEINRKVSGQLNREFISSVEWRVKSPESCVSKLLRKEKEVTVENAVERLNDIAGVRVVCSFLDDIYQLCHQMSYDYNFEFIKQKDYVKNPKSSGYQSLHLIVWVPVGEIKVKAEIQFRTQAMDFWAGVEHHFIYKKEEPHQKEIEKELRRCAKAIYKIDKKMMDIRNRIEKE